MKKEILETLKKNKEKFISGEELSQRIGVSRTAIWKHIKGLKEEGYRIESIPRRGYRLVNEPDTLDKNALEIELEEKVIGQKIYHFESIDSTNTMAKKIAAEGAPEGTILIAEEQVGGRGRLGRSWISPKGTGIWMSIILRPPITPMEATKITQITAAAVALGIENSIGRKVGIKWPNDIIVDNKKVCGILTEMGAELNSINYIVIGIGINVNVDTKNFPEDIRRIATSIKESIGYPVSRKNMVINILNELERLYLNFIKDGSIGESIEICKKYSVTLGKKVRIIYGEQEILGEAMDLTENGELIIRNEQGEIERIISGEVSVRGLSDYI